jgi:hypothetical protein
MATGDLITAARAVVNLPGVSAGDSSVATLVTAASRAVQKYCRRYFVSTAFDELYSGNGQRRLFLRQIPILSVESVRYRPVTVLTAQNTDTTTNQQARVSVTSTGLALKRVASGTATTNTLTFAGNATLTALANAIAALGGGWTAQVVGDANNYGKWPSADLYCPQGPTAGDFDATYAGQGALTAWGQNAELKMHTYELAGYQIADRGGWLLRAIPYTDPELLHPEDLVWPVGVNNLRVQYTAGFTTVPEDVQEAAAELVASWYKRLGRDLSLRRESAGGVTQIQFPTEFPPAVLSLLAPYRLHKLTIPGG